MVHRSKHFHIALLAAILIHAMAFIHLPWPGVDIDKPKVSKVINLHLDAGGGVLWNRVKDQDSDYIQPQTTKELSTVPIDQKLRLHEKKQAQEKKVPKKTKKKKQAVKKETVKTKKKAQPKKQNEWQSVAEAVNQIEEQVGEITPTVSQPPQVKQQAQPLSPAKQQHAAVRMTPKQQQLVRYTQAIALWYNKYQVLPDTPKNSNHEHVRVPVRILVDEFGNVLQFMILKPIEQGVLEEVVMMTLNAVDSVPPPPVELFDNVGVGEPVAFEFALHYW